MTAPRTMPQRLSPRAFPGSLLKHARRQKGRERLIPTPADDDHAKAIRELPCLKCGLDPCGECAHVRMNSAALGKQQALGKRPTSEWTVPLCRACHQGDSDSQHKIGEQEFWHRLGINPLLAAQRLHAVSPDVARMRAVAFVIIGERR